MVPLEILRFFCSISMALDIVLHDHFPNIFAEVLVFEHLVVGQPKGLAVERAPAISALIIPVPVQL